MIGEIDEVKIIATPKQYKKYKKSLEKQLEEKDKEIEKLKKQIKIKNKYCQLIYDIGFDYDGYSKADDLKMIIDELVSYSIDAINCDENKVMYVDANGKKSNILMEEIK